MHVLQPRDSNRREAGMSTTQDIATLPLLHTFRYSYPEDALS